MKYCGNCGSANDEGVKFCKACGEKFNDVSNIPETARGYGIETKIIQVNNDPSIINEASELWRKFGWVVSNVQVTHSQNSTTYTKGFSDYCTGMKTVETTTINYATITLQRNKGIPYYQQIVELQKEYEDLTSALSLLDDNVDTYALNIPLLVVVFLLFWPAGVYMLYKYNKEKNSWKETQNLVRERSGNES